MPSTVAQRVGMGHPDMLFSPAESRFRDAIALLYIEWRHKWNRALARSVRLHVDHAEGTEVILEVELRQPETPAIVYEEMLRDVIHLATRARRSYLILRSPDLPYIGAFLPQPCVNAEEIVSWSHEPFQFARRATFGQSARKVPLELVAGEVAAIMQNRPNEVCPRYPADIRRLARIGFGLIAGSLAFSVSLLFVDTPSVVCAMPGLTMAGGLFALGSVIGKVNDLNK